MRKPLLVIASALLALLAAEGVARVLAWRADRPHRAGELRERWARLVDPSGEYVPDAAGQTAPDAEARPILHPYTGAERGYDTGSVITTFERGFDDDAYTVVVVGGSVAAAWTVQNKELLEARLADDPRLAGRTPHVLNFAHYSYKQPQQVMRIAYLLSLGHRPDAVLSIDGFNEVALGLANHLERIHPAFPSPPVWAALVKRLDRFGGAEADRMVRLQSLGAAMRATARRALSVGAEHSAVLSTLVTRRLARLNVERFELYQEIGDGTPARTDLPQRWDRAARQLGGPPFEGGPLAALEACARNWFEASVSLQALCDARGIAYVHALQPTLHDEGAKPFSDEERALADAPRGWVEGARIGYPLLRERVPELEARGVRFVDLSRLFEDHEETLYVDDCHLNRRGNALFGRALTEAFVEALP